LALTASPRQISSINQEFLGSSFNREPGLTAFGSTSPSVQDKIEGRLSTQLNRFPDRRQWGMKGGSGRQGWALAMGSVKRPSPSGEVRRMPAIGTEEMID
jgi:hypothetical protein